nr:hypothetical protein [Enemella evansiae]
MPQMAAGPAVSVQCPWWQELRKPITRIEADLPPVLVVQSLPRWFDQSVMVWAEQHAVVQTRRSVQPPGPDVVRLAAAGGLVAAREDAATVAGDQRGAEFAFEEPVRLADIQGDAEAVEDDGDDLGVAGQQTELLRGHRTGRRVGAADAPDQSVEVDGHIHPRAVVPARRCVPSIGIRLREFDQCVGAPRRTRGSTAAEPAGGAGAGRATQWWLVIAMSVGQRIQQGGEFLTVSAWQLALDPGGAVAVVMQVEASVATGGLFFLLEATFQQGVGVVGVDDLNETIPQFSQFGRIPPLGLVDHRLLRCDLLLRCEVRWQVLQRLQDRRGLPGRNGRLGQCLPHDRCVAGADGFTQHPGGLICRVSMAFPHPGGGPDSMHVPGRLMGVDAGQGAGGVRMEAGGDPLVDLGDVQSLFVREQPVITFVEESAQQFVDRLHGLDEGNRTAIHTRHSTDRV